MKATIRAICVGQPKPIRGDEMSAIAKSPVSGPVRVTRLGLDGDTQADRTVHGGDHMALHHYPHDHYEWWSGELDRPERLGRDGAFGENISSEGLTEGDVHIGDRFRFGTALIEVSQGRQPCWKLERHLDRKGVIKRILSSHRCGWYYRVIEEGIAQAGDILELADIGHARWSVDRAFKVLLDPSYKAESSELIELAQLSALSPAWRAKATKLIG